MIIYVEKRYMVLIVSEYAREKTLSFELDGKNIITLKARLSISKGHAMYYDMRNYVGQSLEMLVTPECDFFPTFTDAPDDSGIYSEALRPVCHFTPKRGWNNDPNGLILLDGVYHLFFQHNPVDTVWNNMHWGHAVSRDLLHWEETETALYPDEHGAMFSGSAVCSENKLYLFYTAASAHSTQRLAISTDGGKTFQKQEEAVIDTITDENRDPKVIYVPELGKYVLALYLTGESFALFTSTDLKGWTLLQRVTLEGDNECPDFYPLWCEGTKYYVFIAAHDRYTVGKIENGCFLPLYPTGKLHYGNKSYAAQSFSGMEDDRRVRFAWNQSAIVQMPIQGSMSTPQEMTLHMIDGVPTLCAMPIKEFESLRREKTSDRDFLRLSGRANDIVLEIPCDAETKITLMGLPMKVKDSTLFVQDIALPLYVRDGVYTLRMVQDVHSVEIYSDLGQYYALVAHIADESMPHVSCEGAEITAWPLENIHF